MKTQVRETAAGKSISAYIVLNPKGKHVATVNAHFANSGMVTVDLWNIGDQAAERCLAAAIKSGDVTEQTLEKARRAAATQRDWLAADADLSGYIAFDLFGLQRGSAGGGGYDKFTAALSRMYIDGHKMYDHCGHSAESEKLLAAYAKHYDTPEGHKAVRAHWDAKAEKIGACFANYDSEKGRFTSLHITAGLRRLESMGYTVIQAI
jgi:hypothetical protein